MKKIAAPEILAQFEARQIAMQDGKAGMFTTSELCRLLSVSNQAISLWVSKGTIPHFRLGTLLRFDPAQLIEWLERRQA